MNQPFMPYVETMTAMVDHFANFVGPRKPEKPSTETLGTRKEWIWHDISDVTKGGYWYPFDQWRDEDAVARRNRF